MGLDLGLRVTWSITRPRAFRAKALFFYCLRRPEQPGPGRRRGGVLEEERGGGLDLT